MTRKTFAWLLILLAATAGLAGCAEEEAQEDVDAGAPEPEENAGPAEEGDQPSEGDDFVGQKEIDADAHEQQAPLV